MGRIKRLKRTLCLPVDLKEITSGFWPLTLRRHFPIVFFCVSFCVLCRHFHFVFCHVTLLLSEKGWLWVEVLSSESPLSALARIGKVLSRPWPQTKCGILRSPLAVSNVRRMMAKRGVCAAREQRKSPYFS